MSAARVRIGEVERSALTRPWALCILAAIKRDLPYFQLPILTDEDDDDKWLDAAFNSILAVQAFNRCKRKRFAL